MTFKMLATFLVLTLSAAFQEVQSQTVETETKSILTDKGELLPEIYDRVLPALTTSQHRLEDPESALRKLVEQQQQTLDSIDCLRTRSWVWLTKLKSKKPTLILAEHLYLTDPVCTRLFNWYPKEGVEQLGIEPRHENFDLVLAKILTPQMVVSSFGFARKGLDEISIKDATPHNAGRDLKMLLFQFGALPKDVFERIKAATAAGNSQYDVRVNGDLVELTEWPSSSSREKSESWVFNKACGGLLVRHENKLVSTMNLLVEMNHVEIDGRWLPSELVIEKINRKTKKIESREQYDFFETNLVDPDTVDHKEFTIRSLPVKDENVRINDGRNGLRRSYKFKEIK